MIVIEGAVTLRKSENLEDWYLIERAEHDGKEWEEKTPYGFAYQHSARISDADIEGSLEDMKAIAEAIVARTEFCSRRCAVRVINNDHALLWSPRNSRSCAAVTLAAADALAKQILGLVAEK